MGHVAQQLVECRGKIAIDFLSDCFNGQRERIHIGILAVDILPWSAVNFIGCISSVESSMSCSNSAVKTDKTIVIDVLAIHKLVTMTHHVGCKLRYQPQSGGSDVFRFRVSTPSQKPSQSGGPDVFRFRIFCSRDLIRSTCFIRNAVRTNY
jgi:hypothetical protein